jgi:hypothetical protein
MKNNKVTIKSLRLLIKEELATTTVQSQGVGKLLDDLVNKFAIKMKEQHPGADELIQKEAQDLKMQLTAQIKASAAKVKTSVKPS